MANDDGTPTAGSTLPGSTNIIRVLANVVETQKSVAQHFGSLVSNFEDHRSEVRQAISSLTDELRRNMATLTDEVRRIHAAERTQLISQNNELLALLRDRIQSAAAPNNQQRLHPQAPQFTAPIQAYNNAMPAAAMFGQDPAQLALLSQFNELNLQSNGALSQQAAAIWRTMQQSAHPQQQPPTSQAPALLPQLSQPTKPASGPQPPAAVAVPATAAAPAASFIKPTASTPTIVKSDDNLPTTVIPAPAQTKPGLSFGGSSSTSTSTATSSTAKTVFGLPIAAASDSKPGLTFGSPVTATHTEAEVKKEPVDDDDNEHVEEYEPEVHFTPVIPLPDKVDTVTGEEKEKILLEDRCKLYRFTGGQWKERATGTVKILKDEATGKCRAVVRRDGMVLELRNNEFVAAVHKVGANFPIVEGIKVSKMGSNEKAVVWHCIDFAKDDKDAEDGNIEVEGRSEQFSAKFSNAHTAEAFMKTINDIVENLKTSPVKPTAAKETKKATAPEEPKRNDEPKKSEGFGDQFKLKPGSWTCTGCYLNWEDGQDCSVCGLDKNGAPAAEKDIFAKAPQPPPPAPAKSFSFGFTAAAPSPPSMITTNTDAAAKPASSAPKFTFAQMAASAAKEAESKEKTGTTPALGSSIFGAGANAAAVSPATFSFKTGPPAITTLSSPAPTASLSAAGFSFKTPDASKSIFGGGPKTTLFGGSSAVTPVQSTEPEVEKKETPGQIFGSSFMQGGGIGFSAFKGKPSIFDDKEKVEAGQKAFANLAKSKPFGHAAAAPPPPPAENEEEGDTENPEEYEPAVDFAPVVPLPDLIEVKTGEEEELVKFCYRAKIYRFVKELNEHKEKGVGDLKILNNPQTGKYRVVMRREQVHKLCANFPILKDAKLNKTDSRPAVLNIVANDFSEDPSGVVEMLSIKFKSAEIANDFERAFKDAQSDS